MSQLTTHILDTSKGKPAAGVPVFLLQPEDNRWKEIASGHTDPDGRIPGFLAPDVFLAPGVYKLHFGTKEYFQKEGVNSFYPYVEISFIISDNTHYHVPLLLNPFGYSTYRGS